MSLRVRMLALIGLFLALMAAAGAAVMIANARDAVRAEMASALRLGVVLAQAEIGRGSAPDAIAALDRLGLRHLRFIAGESPPVPVSDTDGTPQPAPGWFAALIGVTPQDHRLTDAGGRVLLTVLAEPWDEVAEVWEDMRGLALAMLAAGLLLLAAAWVAVGRALAPLARFEAEVKRLRAGLYDIGVPGGFNSGSVPELARLGASIAALADGLAVAEQENRRLGQRLVETQDHERRDIARDIHDELGATLFAIKVDAGRILRLTDGPSPDDRVAADADRERAEVAERARAVLSTAADVHDLSRRILVRLRPALLDQLPLSEALSELVCGWARREPSVRWSLDIDGKEDESSPTIDGLDEVLRLTIFRLVQESLVNALRHAKPSRVTVSVRRLPDQVEVAVADDGPGLSSATATEMDDAERGGFGISGMAERVSALGGSLVIGPDGGRGTRVAACLPCSSGSLDMQCEAAGLERAT